METIGSNEEKKIIEQDIADAVELLSNFCAQTSCASCPFDEVSGIEDCLFRNIDPLEWKNHIHCGMKTVYYVTKDPDEE